VVLESTGNALAIANILRSHVADVVLAYDEDRLRKLGERTGLFG
jgi:hypothetical protein